MDAALIVSLLPALVPSGQDERPVGPVVGHVDHERALVWFRPTERGEYRIVLRHGNRADSTGAEAMAERDRCIEFHVDGLEPATEYTYEIRRDLELVAGGPDHRLRTSAEPGTPSTVRLAFGSCASSEASSVWSTIQLASVDGLVLLGDTPYIDTTDLERARAAHRRFLEVPELACLARCTPVWGTWDDHDFGANDSDGTLPGKANTRRAFVEHRAHVHDGDGEHGVYTTFRRGPVEVFLLDTRYFARTAPAGEGSDDPTLLGAGQWRWLEDGLRRSTAPFKVLACGMIWDDKENSESDDWGSYPHERSRLERFLGEHDVSGAVLVGGDIHVSRHLRYPGTQERVGYVLDQFIVSPLHESVIPSLDVEHPALLWSAKEPRVFLELTVSDEGEAPWLEARWIQDDGRGAGRELRRVRRTLADLTR